MTVGLTAAGRFPALEVIPYWIAQIMGGLCAVGTIALVFGDSATDALGTIPGAAVDDWGALLLEAIVTALLVMVILTVTLAEGAAWRGMMAPLLIGLVIFTGALAVGPSSGGSFNPARSFVPVIYNGEWGDLWIYLVGPFAGAIVGGAIWSWRHRRPRAKGRDDLSAARTVGRQREAPPRRGFFISGRPDSNRRPPAPKAGALPG